jgi:hypothetical protein
MDSPLQLTRQDLMYVAMIGAGIGLILGLIPLVLAIRKGKIKLGLLAIVLSTIGGALSVIVSVVVVAIFIWLILRKPASIAADRGSDSGSQHS